MTKCPSWHVCRFSYTYVYTRSKLQFFWIHSTGGHDMDKAAKKSFRTAQSAVHLCCAWCPIMAPQTIPVYERYVTNSWWYAREHMYERTRIHIWRNNRTLIPGDNLQSPNDAWAMQPMPRLDRCTMQCNAIVLMATDTCLFTESRESRKRIRIETRESSLLSRSSRWLNASR